MEVKMLNEVTMSTMWTQTPDVVKKSSSCDLRPPALRRQAQGGAASHSLRGPLLTLLLLAGAAAFLKAESPSKTRIVTIGNTEPRRDVDGNIIDAHGGCLHFFEGRYYLYGEAYGKTAGYTIDNRFRVYSSVDLTHWKFEGELLKSPPDGVYYRPYVIYNRRTHKYILWYNWYKKLWDGEIGVATSETPVGPFTIQNTHVQLSQANDHPGDGSLFVDDDDTAYFIYTVIGQNHSIRVERLTGNYLSSTGESSSVLGEQCEAPALFRRGQYYYAVFGHTCCFCGAGSDARVLIATNPLGPYKQIGDINREAAGKPAIGAQQAYIAAIPTAQGPQFIWIGDLWRSRKDGIKGHDLQYWSPPLHFSEDGSIRPIENVPSWSTELVLGDTRSIRHKPYVWPQKIDPNPLRRDACYGTPLNERGEPIP